MSFKLTEVSLEVTIGGKGHVNVTQMVISLIPSVNPEQIHIDKRVYEDNPSIVYVKDAQKNDGGDLILEYNNDGNKDNVGLTITAVIYGN